MSGRRSYLPFPAEISGNAPGEGAAALAAANRGAIWDEATTSAEGAAGPTIVALIQAVVRKSGVFRFNAKGDAVVVAADVSTWTLTVQSGTGAVATTGGTEVPTTNGFPPTGGLSEVATSGTPGTGIVITSGAGTSETIASEASTIGAGATLVDKFSAGGLIQNGATGLPFVAGQNVFLVLSYTNSVTNRAISNLVLSLTEE